MAYGQKLIVDCSKPRGEQMTRVDLTQAEITRRDAQRAAADQREQTRKATEQAEADQLQADIDALDTADDAKLRDILKRRLTSEQAARGDR